MYCSYCAGVLDPSQAVCPKCGRAVEAAPVAVPVAVPMIAAAAPAGERPSSVRLAALLLLIALGISMLSVAGYVLRPGVYSRLPASYIARTIGFLGLEIVLLVCIWQRQAWARIGLALALVWAIGNLSITILRIGGSVAFASTFLVSILVAGLRVWALYLLFRPESNGWYRNKN
jgi:hypothetical protein